MRTTKKPASEHSQELSLSELDQVAGALFDLGPLNRAIHRVVQLTQTMGGSGTDGGDSGGGSDPGAKLFQGLLQQMTQGQG